MSKNKFFFVSIEINVTKTLSYPYNFFYIFYRIIHNADQTNVTIENIHN